MPQQPYRLNENQFQKVYDYIEINLCRSIEIQELADLVNLSLPYFIQAFKFSTGFPPHRYITNLRLDKAVDMLVDTDLKISEIAEQIGYSNFTHFGSIFTKYHRVSPQAYRSIARILSASHDDETTLLILAAFSADI